jgi:hypothetical protein
MLIKINKNFFSLFYILKIYRMKLNYRRVALSLKSLISIQSLSCILGIFIGLSLATLMREKVFNCSFIKRRCCLTGLYAKIYVTPESADSNNKIFETIEPKNKLVFIIAMTAQKFLDTRSRAVYETWGKNIAGKIAFFSRAGSKSQYSIPIVSLPGVDDSYPPLKKFFVMLKYIYDNYIDDFEWFMRVDDDIYIRPEKLETFLRSINSSKPYYIGQAGQGSKQDFGKLSLDHDENFCMGGPGVVISRETLKLVLPHIKTCIKNLYSIHDDVEFGRCIKRFAGISCTWSNEVSSKFLDSTVRKVFISLFSVCVCLH